MGEMIEFKRPDGKTCPGYLATPKTGSASLSDPVATPEALPKDSSSTASRNGPTSCPDRGRVEERCSAFNWEKRSVVVRLTLS